MISDLGFLFHDRNSKFLDQILIFLEIKIRVRVLIKHYSCMVVSCFFFRFLFLLFVRISVSNLVHQHCEKKKGLPNAIPIETWHSTGPVYKKKKMVWKKQSVLLCSLLFVSISYWVFFSFVLFVFRTYDCVRLIWIWLGFLFWVI